MIKRSLVILTVAAAFYAQAQDVSTVRNSVDVYSGYSLPGSAKLNAMAGSGGALGGDATSLLTNPAGLGVAISSNIGATLGIQNYKTSAAMGNSAVDFNKTMAELSNVNGVAAFQLLTETPWKFVNVGVNISTRNLDQYIESPGNNNIVIQKDLVDQSNTPVVGNMTYMGHGYDRTGVQTKMGIGVGANYDNRLYFGAGLNFHSGTLEQYDTALMGLDLDNSVNYFSKQYTPFTEVSNGFSASLGVIGKVNNQLRLGAAIETPTWWGIDRVYRDYYTDTSGYISYEDLAEDRTFTSPMKAMLSAAFVPNKNFSINLDYGIGLTKPKYKVQGAAETELNEFFSEFSNNTSEIKVGAEYRIKSLRLRGGYAHTTSPFDAVTISSYNQSGNIGNNSFSDFILGKRNTVGLGVGYDFRSFYIDLAYQNHNSEYSNPFLFGSVANASPRYTTGYHSGDFDVSEETSAVSQVKHTENNVYLTVGWKF
ncbi:OmpP1/FadL family transporter [Chryseobacterium sp. MFBS3-17]|uniref:OmpP1/FadL family transporter n=1 Tax=Chryseobacterium sp. MFBS3-17 TaxID=2886689 RepID=UPI001D0E6E3F|nr:hemin receptor [Chryseobacterium sp. MFBS3-17]MCC2591461.1 hemin receptor [Chryseobacterium sp. MFBS3-17]